MAFATIDVTKGITGVLPSANATYTSLRKNAKPLIINGDMQIAQRSTSVSGLTSSGAIQTVDRIKNEIGNIGTYTVAQESLSSGEAYNNGFRKAWRIDTTTADASPSAGDSLYVTYHFEGQDLQLFKKGTSNAEKFTLAFWIKSNKTGTGQVNLRDNDNSRLIGGTYTISSADTWEHKVVNFASDTTGAFDNDNAGSMDIEWWLDSGTTYSSGTTPTSWEAFSQADRNASGNLQIARNTANDWSITGIQLEVGEYTSSTLPPFQHESFGDNLLRCKRYYQTTIMPDTSDYWGQGYYYTNSEFTCKMPIQEMRAQPTLDQVSGSNYFTVYSNNAGDTINDFALDGSSSRRCVSFTDTGESSGTAGFGGGLYKTNASARFAFDADL
jgi:hypothetical protein